MVYLNFDTHLEYKCCMCLSECANYFQIINLVYVKIRCIYNIKLLYTLLCQMCHLSVINK